MTFCRLACPQGTTQFGNLNDDIEGTGLEGVITAVTMEQCKQRCTENLQCAYWQYLQTNACILYPVNSIIHGKFGTGIICTSATSAHFTPTQEKKVSTPGVQQKNLLMSLLISFVVSQIAPIKCSTSSAQVDKTVRGAVQYILVQQKKNWWDARTYCRTQIKGGRFAKVMSADDASRMVQAVKDQAGVIFDAWIGVNGFFSLSSNFTTFSLIVDL